MARRVVITGLGAVTPLGVGVSALWDGLLHARSGVKPITRFDASNFNCKLGGEVAGFSAKDSVPKHYRKAVKVMARDIELAVGAAKEAAEDARLTTRGTLSEDSTDPTTHPSARMGCHIGAGLISAESDELTAAFSTAAGTGGGGVDLEAWGRTGMENLTPLWMLKYLPNMLACHVTIIHGCEGPSNTITCAEASGLLCIGESARVIERGDADLCFSGSAECKHNLMGLLRTEYAGRLAKTGSITDPAAICKPFDATSLGCGASEGGAILILEEAAAAAKRGAKVYAILSGFGAGQSGPPTNPILGDARPDEGLQAAIENALDDARLKPAEIDAVVVFGTGVPALDAAEAGALAKVFPNSQSLPIVTLGPNLGTTMAGNGSIMAAVGTLCIHHQQLPARIHAGTPSLPGAKGPARQAPLRHMLVAGSSLGGQNAAIILSRT